MKMHHIGYAVRSLTSSIIEFEKLGFNKTGAEVIDEDRNVAIQFIELDEHSIELIAPLNDASPVAKILKNRGEGPYHICYIVDDIEKEIERLVKDKYLMFEQPKPALAVEGKRVAFLFKNGIGIIELIEGPGQEL
jgi:methylmalonyl-CoA/ethylmalonyl-CoA epimerase